MQRAATFLIGFAGGIAGLIGVLALVFTGLQADGRLKAPTFSNRLSFDEKLRQMRRNDVTDLEVLLVGSSTTLHGIDGDVLKAELGFTGAVYNFGVQDLRINQSRFVADTFLKRYPNAERLVMVSTTLDFKDCTSAETRFFNPEHVIDYVFDDGAELFYQFKYLDLKGVFGQAGSIQHLRQAASELEAVAFDDYGSLLLTLPREKINPRVWRGDPITLDPACYAALGGLAADLRQAGVAFTYVIAPMRPGYLTGRDPDGSLLRQHYRQLEEAFAGTPTTVVDAHAAMDLPEAAFFDAYHVNRPYAEDLTRFLSHEITALAARDQRRDDRASRLQPPEAEHRAGG